MLLTEDEARKNWCPFARVIVRDADTNKIVAGNRGFVNPGCVGSECMSWRWSRARETKAYLQAVQEHMKETGDNFNKATQKVYAEIGSTFEETEGFCGLAGGIK